ncbi:MAG: hypothetical protein CL920_11055 [Deltaproteobacteria bacterium]|nr:hypothetical protein [Deltaproteobacteria bacterium]
MVGHKAQPHRKNITQHSIQTKLQTPPKRHHITPHFTQAPLLYRPDITTPRTYNLTQYEFGLPI